MKLLGANDDMNGGRGPPNRSQDDASVGYVFQRHPNEPEFPHFAHKQPRWASGDDAIIDVSIFIIYISKSTHSFLSRIYFSFVSPCICLFF